MRECEEYIQFVTRKIQEHINHYYSIHGRTLDDITGIYASKKIEALKELADDLGMMIE